jgi:hypothetical protein
LEVWDSNGGFDAFPFIHPGESLTLRSYSRETTYAVRLSVYNSGHWRAKDYDVFGYGARVEVYKYRRGDFRFNTWYLR